MRVVGQRVPREDAEAKARGVSKYVADMKLPGMLYGKVVWSDTPHADAVRVETAAARRLPGVRAVLTAVDVPGRNINPLVVQDQPFLVEDRIRYPGEAVALVAAETVEAARTAAHAVRLEYSPL
ncbi:hypothetical protein JW905_08940, partial [bacterium]|nr:hypothetical protein [candidate division CSSED10-310 bacterium]